MLGRMPGSVRVARILGIDIRIHFSWIVIFFLVVVTLADNIFPASFPAWSRPKVFVVSAVAAFLFFCSILAHELAHAVVARRFRMSVSSITLFLLGGVANLTKEPPSARAEFFMAAAGPATSVVIGLAGLGLEAFTDANLDQFPTLQPVGAVAGYLGFINAFVLAPFNLVPGFPLDGGRILRSIIWGLRGDRATATRIAARGGQAVAGLLFLGAVWRLLSGDSGGLWWGLIAYFLYNAATSTLQQERLTGLVGTVRVGQLMTTEFRTTTPGTTVATLIRDLVLPQNLRAIPVVSGERLAGLVTIGDLRKVEQDQWSVTPVQAVMTPLAELATVTPDDQLSTALERFGSTELPLLPVVKDGAIVGLLYRESVVGYVRMREALGLESRR